MIDPTDYVECVESEGEGYNETTEAWVDYNVTDGVLTVMVTTWNHETDAKEAEVGWWRLERIK